MNLSAWRAGQSIDAGGAARGATTPVSVAGSLSRAAWLVGLLLAGCTSQPSADPAFDRARQADPAGVMLAVDETSSGRLSIVILTNECVPTVRDAAEMALREAAAIARRRQASQFHAAFERRYWTASVMRFGRIWSSEPLPYVAATVAVGSNPAAGMSAFATETVLAAPAGSFPDLVRATP